MDVNLELYRVFYYVVKTGSISKAAQELYISQPAVSQAVKLLEKHLGGQLFFRTPKGIKLTPEGEVLYKYIEQGYNLIMLAENKFAEVLNLEAGEVRIGASDMTLRFFLLPYLEEFHRSYPKVKIKVTNGPSPETIDSLKKGMIDFGVVSLPLPQDENINVIESIQIQDCFVAGVKFYELASRTVSLKELSNYPIIMLEKNTSTRRFIDSYTGQHGITLNPEIELATSDLIMQFAERGLGIACIVRNFAEDAILTGRLFEIGIKEKMPLRSFGIITLKDVPVSPSAKKLLDLIYSQRHNL